MNQQVKTAGIDEINRAAAVAHKREYSLENTRPCLLTGWEYVAAKVAVKKLIHAGATQAHKDALKELIDTWEPYELPAE